MLETATFQGSPPRAGAPASGVSHWQPFVWTAVAFVLLAGWDLLGQDLVMARWFGNTTGFAYRDHWLFSGVLHQGARRVAWTLQLGLVIAIWWPVGPMRLLSRRERAHLLIATLTTLLVVWLLKNRSLTSCPWELSEFGGVASYVSHWNWGVPDGGEGKCFPAGHASAGFGFLTGYFWLRHKSSRAALAWLAITLLAGTLIGLAQQVRGAHYMSHTLWTAWVSWVIAGATYLLLEHTRLRRWFTQPGRS